MGKPDHEDSPDDSDEPERRDHFLPRHAFVDDIHGRILLNDLERDVVDTPEYQRLFRINQLGLVDIAYQTATHSRGAHGIGTCHAAARLISALTRPRPSNHAPTIKISRAEEVLIRLGALVHDIPHGPFSHDIEKKTHQIFPFDSATAIKMKSAHGAYEKHDAYQENPAFYVAVFDTERSVLARVLKHYARAFWKLLQSGSEPHLRSFIDVAERWESGPEESLAQMLFHLFAFEHAHEAEESYSLQIRTSFNESTLVKWHMGPETLAESLHREWYQPFRHEIIGNTLSADLLDYLARDCRHLAIEGGIDDSLLRYYVLVRTQDREGKARYRCAIDVFDKKRGIIRSDRLNDIFTMLDVRHQIHEKAVFHRVAQSSLAMLSRSIKLARRTNDKTLRTDTLYGYGKVGDLLDDGTTAMRGDEHFLRVLATHENRDAASLALKIAERRLHRPLMIVPGHRVGLVISREFNPDEAHLRELAALIDSPAYEQFFAIISLAIEHLLRHEFDDITLEHTDAPEDGSLLAFLRDAPTGCTHLTHRVIFWTLPYKQLFKDPAIVVAAQDAAHSDAVHSLDELHQIDPSRLSPEFQSVHARVKIGIEDASIRYQQLWKVYVFISDSLFYGGTMAKLIRDRTDYAFGCAVGDKEHLNHLKTAKILAARAISAAWGVWDERKQKVRDDPSRERVLERFLKTPADSATLRTLINRVRDSDVEGERASEVQLEQYQHGEGETAARCRDIRYRFEPKRSASPGSRLEEVLEAGGIDTEFSESEIHDMEAMFRPDEALLDEIRQAGSEQAARDVAETELPRILRRRARQREP